MNVEMTARIIQLILAPVVMITSCSLVLSGLLSRYAAVNDRMRLMARERLDLLDSTSVTEKFTVERLQEIDHQIPDLLNRHHLLHNSVVIIYVSILLFIVDMFVIALAAVWDSTWLSTAVLVVFVFGTLALFVGVLIAIVEVRSSHRAVEYEAQRVSELSK